MNAGDTGEAEWAPGSSAASGSGRDEEDSGEPSAGEGNADVFYCDLCGHVMLNLHCKLICERCGYKRDCSDP